MVVTNQEQVIRTVSTRDGMLDARHPEAYSRWERRRCAACGPRIQSETLDGYETAGFGFSSYPGRDGYGVSLTSPSAAVHQVERLE